jgi:hypothetical protein
MTETPPVWTVFSSAGRRSSSTLAALVPERVEDARPDVPPDIDALTAAAREEGRREGEARAIRAAEAAAAAARDAAAAALAQARQAWVDTESAALADAFRAQARFLEACLARSLGRSLRPLLARALRREALRAVQATVATVLADADSGTLALSGPADLVTALAQRLDLPPDRLVLAPDDSPDLCIRMNGTVLETQLQAWGERVAALVADPGTEERRR